MTDLEREVLGILEELKGPDFSEVYSKKVFVGYRERKQGGSQKVYIELLDAGPNESNRYHVRAWTEDRKRAAGNPRETVREALIGIHWWDLDK